MKRCWKYQLKVLGLFLFAVISVTAEAATYIVTNLDDSGPGSLRQAVLDANATLTTADTINFDTALTGTITLASQITITDRLTINGPGRDKLTISGNKKTRVFVTDSANATIQDITIQNGFCGDYRCGGGAIYNKAKLTLNRVLLAANSASHSLSDEKGGAIYNAGTLTATDLTLQKNSASRLGGAICNDGTLTVTNLTAEQNTEKNAGAIYNSGTATLVNVSLLSNTATNENGGAIGNDGIMTITNGLISFNRATKSGGGIANWENLTLRNVTVSENMAYVNGGGIANWGDNSNMTFINNTVTLNTANGYGGGVYNEKDRVLTIANSIVAGNDATKGGAQISSEGAKAISQGGNLFGGEAGLGVVNITLLPTDRTLTSSIDTVLGEMNDNGGLLATYALIDSSQAIDGGINELVPAELTTDQRGIGFPRIIGAAVDIGAFEAGDGAAPTAYPLTITLAGKGSVSSASTGLICSGTTCSGSFPIDAEITLTAKPLTGFIFSGWNGACTNKTGSCAVTMNKAQTVTATFTAAPVNYNLTITKVGNGTVTSNPSGINCGTGIGCSAKFSSGKTITLTATPVTGATFVKWTGCTASATNSKQCTLTLTANKTVTATFTSTAATADFIITDIILTPINPVANGLFDAKITVKNKGTGAANGGTLSVWTNRTANPVCSTSGDKAVMVGTIDAGKTKPLTIKQLAAGAAGTKNLYAVVDSKCVLPELNETNNQFTKTYTVK